MSTILQLGWSPLMNQTSAMCITLIVSLSFVALRAVISPTGVLLCLFHIHILWIGGALKRFQTTENIIVITASPKPFTIILQ